MNFLCELMYFYWKISYLGNFLYTAPGQPGGAKTLSGGPGPPGPTLATALYSCHLWHFDQKIVALCLYFYLALLTQRCKGNDTQAGKSQNHCTYIVQNVHCTCTLLFVHLMILTFFIKLFAYLECLSFQNGIFPNFAIHCHSSSIE